MQVRKYVVPLLHEGLCVSDLAQERRAPAYLEEPPKICRTSLPDGQGERPLLLTGEIPFPVPLPPGICRELPAPAPGPL